MEEINKQLETTLAELDYLFQEGVIFKSEDVEKFDILMKFFKSIRTDVFFYVDKLPKI
jgi:hypothetical protein